MNYGYVNVQERYLCLDDSPSEKQWMDGVYSVKDHNISDLNLASYISLLLERQGCERVENKDDAEVVLVMEKCSGEGEISLIDADFFFGE